MPHISDEELEQLIPAEDLSFRSPLPTQIVASTEYFPEPQTPKQKLVEARLKELGSQRAAKLGLSRRKFFQTAAGMATAFAVMNEVYGNFFGVSEAEAATPELADELKAGFAHQNVFDGHTHFLRDDTRLTSLLRMRQAVGKMGWNADMTDKDQTIESLKFANYFKEIFLDSDTMIGTISNSPSEVEADWFITNQMAFDARDKVNAFAGSKRMYAHYTFNPHEPGWLEGIEHAASFNPVGYKGYTIGDNTNKDLAKPWRLDDEKLMYPAYERMVKSGVTQLCIHKGLFPPSLEAKFPHLAGYADVSDVGKAAKDWPQIQFVIFHSGYRHVGDPNWTPDKAYDEWERTGRSSWVTDLAEIPEKYGVNNVYGDLGQIFAYTAVAEPRLAAALMGTLIKGLGADKILWGTDAVWTGSPQWQIEGLRRLEIPEDMQKRFGFKPLGAADGPVKRAIFAENGYRLFKIDPKSTHRNGDKVASIKADYIKNGPTPSNLRYGYARKGGG
jgi:predicted TIM-barrel fold metal-dependent hydrolase